MCVTCGCGDHDAKIEGESMNVHHHHGHSHSHGHNHDHDHDHDIHVIGGVHAPGMDQRRIIKIEQDILAKNNHLAMHNREGLEQLNVLALNLVSSPGSGKTTLLARTATDLGEAMPVAVIEGDQQTELDANRIRETGAAAVQINTGKGCHLDADMVRRAMETLKIENGGLLFIENVGNLVCPAAFDLGEAAKVVILSVTEGEDKPLKYPDMFRAAQLMVLNKSDLLPFVPFNVEKCVEYARRVNPEIEVLQVCALNGEGMDDWYDWIRKRRSIIQNHHARADDGVRE